MKDSVFVLVGLLVIVLTVPWLIPLMHFYYMWVFSFINL